MKKRGMIYGLVALSCVFGICVEVDYANKVLFWVWYSVFCTGAFASTIMSNYYLDRYEKEKYRKHHEK